jgi:N-acetylglucosaminyldiphosphoundecaprenol N-acetyl-beta-D-mannosaminyltransferase
MNSAQPDTFASLPPAKPSPELQRANVLGIGVHAVNPDQALGLIATALKDRIRGYICVTGVHGIMEAQRHREFRRVLDGALLVLPDGMPTVWVGRWQGHMQMRRVFGPDFMLAVCRRSVTEGWTHFVYGGKAGVAEELRTNLQERFPGIQIVGTYTPPFRELTSLEDMELQEQIRQLSPDIVWIGLSTPKQERFMAQYMPRLNCKLMIGVGAAFDIHTGGLRDAPDWVKNAGLQWLHRLCQEPSRLWKRYLINNSMFLLQIGLQFSGLRRHRLET